MLLVPLLWWANMAELYSTGTNRILYRAETFGTEKTVTAYFWNPSLEKSDLQTFTEIEQGLYYLDYNFASEGTYIGLFYEDGTKKASQVFRVSKLSTISNKLDDTLEDDEGVYRFTENALEQAPSGAGLTEAQQTQLETIYKVAQADMKIDTTSSPWQLVLLESGTDTEIMRKDLKDKDGNNIASINSLIGQYIATS